MSIKEHGDTETMTTRTEKLNYNFAEVLPNEAPVNAQTGTTYTILPTDIAKIITLNNASAITVTVPNTLPAGFNCTLVQKGAGQVTVTGTATGATINNRNSHDKTAGQHAAASLVCDVIGNFYFQGDTSA